MVRVAMAEDTDDLVAVAEGELQIVVLEGGFVLLLAEVVC